MITISPTILTIIILSLTTVVATTFLIIQYFKNRKITEKSDKVEKRNKELSTMFLSDKALYTTNLIYDKKLRFDVSYEVEVTEMTNKSAKLTALSFKTDNSEMSATKHRKLILNYMKDQWIPIENIEFIIDGDAAKRDIRLGQLLDKN